MVLVSPHALLLHSCLPGIAAQLTTPAHYPPRLHAGRRLQPTRRLWCNGGGLESRRHLVGRDQAKLGKYVSVLLRGTHRPRECLGHGRCRNWRHHPGLGSGLKWIIRVRVCITDSQEWSCDVQSTLAVQASSTHLGFADRASRGEPDGRFFLGQIVGKVRMVRPEVTPSVNE